MESAYIPLTNDIDLDEDDDENHNIPLNDFSKYDRGRYKINHF